MSAPTTNASVTTNPGGTGATITPTLPTHAVGDEIRIWVVNSGVTAWSAPVGWTIRQQQASSGNASTGVIGTLLYHKVVSGDTLPLASPICNLGATVTRSAVAFTVRGADLEGVHTLWEWLAFGSTTGTANPVRPPSVTTRAPEMLVHICYGSRSATNAPEQTNYTEVQQVVISGTIVNNVSQRTIADQNTTLSNQDASPTSGARWIAMISCSPSPDYPYYRAGSQAFNASGTNVTPALPTGTSSSDNRGNKDTIILTTQCAGVAPTVNTPAHWTLIDEWSTTTSGGATTVRKWRAIYNGTLDRQVNRTPAGEIFAYLSTYHNTHQTTPVGTSAVQQNASSTTSTFPALTRTGTKATVQATCVADGTPTFTAPSGWTERNDSQGVTCADQSFNATGTTASASFTLSSASPTLAGLMEVFSVASAIATILTPANATVTTTTFAPQLRLVVTPPSASLSLATFAPSLVTSGLLADDFDDNSRDTAKWSLGSIAFQNAGVGVAEANQQIEITPLSNEASPAIYGYKSANAYNFTGRQATIRIAADIDTNTEAWLVVALNADNYLRTWVASGVLNTRSRVAASNSNEGHGAFSFSTHTYWRIRHDETPDQIVWEYSANGSSWTELRRISRPFAITAVTFYLSGGTGGSVSSPPLVKFDDFALTEAAEVTTVTPANASVALTAFAPSLKLSVTLAITSLTTSRFAPQLREVATPGVQSLATATFTPALATAITIPATSLSLATFAPAVTATAHVTVTPATAALTTTALAPVFRETVTPASQLLTLTAFTPQLVRVITPASANPTLTTTAPTVTTHTFVVPATTTLTLTAFTPTLIEQVTPTVTALTLSTFAPTVVANVTAAPNVTSLSLASFVPALQERLTPSVTPLSLTTFAPSVTVSADIIVTPSVQSLVLTTLAPTLHEQTTPATNSLSTTAFAPTITVSADRTVQPDSTLLSLQVFAPVLRLSATPAAVTLTTTTTAPVIGIQIQPASAAVALTTFAPTLTVSGDVSVIPSSRSLALTTFAPLVTAAAIPAPPRRTFMVSSDQRTVLVRRETREFKPAREDRELVVQ